MEEKDLDYEIIIKDKRRGLEVSIGFTDFAFWTTCELTFGELIMDQLERLKKKIREHQQ